MPDEPTTQPLKKEPEKGEEVSEQTPENTLEPEAEPATESIIEPSAEIPQEPEPEPEVTEPQSAPQPPTIIEPRQESEPQPAAPEPLPRPRTIIKEVIVEKEKPLTTADKEKIFKEQLKSKLRDANAKKHENFETHLQEIVDFMKAKGTLVANQDIEDSLDIPDATVTRRLNKLIERGTVVRLGDQYHAKYKLTSAV